MKSVRQALLFLLAIAMLLGVAACISESGDQLNPQPLPPGSGSGDENPPEQRSPADKNGAMGSSGSSGTGDEPPAAAPADAGAPDGRALDTRWSLPKVH